MKKTSILTIMIAFIAISTFAQTPASPQPPRQMPTPEERAQRATDRMKAQLNLTPEQYQKILDINKDFYTQQNTMRTPGQPVTDDARAKMKAMSQAKDDKINGILTAEQRAKLAASPKPGGPGMMKGAPAPANGNGK